MVFWMSFWNKRLMPEKIECRNDWDQLYGLFCEEEWELPWFRIHRIPTTIELWLLAVILETSSRAVVAEQDLRSHGNYYRNLSRPSEESWTIQDLLFRSVNWYERHDRSEPPTAHWSDDVPSPVRWWPCTTGTWCPITRGRHQQSTSLVRRMGLTYLHWKFELTRFLFAPNILSSICNCLKPWIEMKLNRSISSSEIQEHDYSIKTLSLAYQYNHKVDFGIAILFLQAPLPDSKPGIWTFNSRTCHSNRKKFCFEFGLGL